MTYSAHELRRGRETGEPDDVVELRAGPLTADLVGSDLRSVRWGETEVIQRIYMAVRDAPWNTIPGEILQREVTVSDREFRVSWRQRHRFEDIDVEWSGVVVGTDDGVIVYEMDAVAGGAFRHSKIGLNIHHGLVPYRNCSFRATTESGEVTGILAEDVEPQLVRDGSLTAMFDHFDAISFELGDLTAEFQFEGDRFEMQDHRNWSDANYKTYGTPLSFGFPRDVTEGERLWQRITVRLHGDPVGGEQPEEIALGGDQPTRLPSIGHRLTTVGEPAEKVLGLLRPDFLRVEVRPDEQLSARLAEARKLTSGGVPLEIVSMVDPDDPKPAIEDLQRVLTAEHADVARVIVLAAAQGFSEFKGATPPELGEEVSRQLVTAGVSVPVFSGTDQFFNEVNRARPDYTRLDGVAFSLNPQVHACDDRSLMANVEALPDVAAFCRRMYPGAELSVGPVHLVGPNGPFPAGPPSSAGVPAGLDPRHAALFGAAWTVAFLAAAARGGVEHVTMYDLVGSRGLAQLVDVDEDGARYPVEPGTGYPVLWVLERLRALGPSTAFLVEGTNDRCAAVRLQSGDRRRVVVANLANAMTQVALDLAPATSAEVWTMDETLQSGVDVLVSRTPPRVVVEIPDGRLPIVLRPYAVACIDTAR